MYAKKDTACVEERKRWGGLTASHKSSPVKISWHHAEGVGGLVLSEADFPGSLCC